MQLCEQLVGSDLSWEHHGPEHQVAA